MPLSAHMASMTEPQEDFRSHFVYRLFSADEDLLYVGVTYDVAARFINHHSKPWWPEVNQWKITATPSRVVALYLEAEAILTEHPKYNIDIPTWGRFRALRSRADPDHVINESDRMLLLEAENTRLRLEIKALSSAFPRESRPITESSPEPLARPNVTLPALLSGRSHKDVEFLRAMAVDDGPSLTADIGRRIGAKPPLVSKYRSRLLDAGLIERTGHGMLNLAIPDLRELLRTPLAA